jgi:hypothetical protein
MLEMMEPDSAILPSYKMGSTLKLSSPQNWTAEASDFLRNTSSASISDLAAVSSSISSLIEAYTETAKHRFLKKIDPDESNIDINLWLGYLTGMRTWSPCVN